MLRAPGARSGVWKSPPEGSASTAELVLNVLPVLRLFNECLLISKSSPSIVGAVSIEISWVFYGEILLIRMCSQTGEMASQVPLPTRWEACSSLKRAWAREWFRLRLQWALMSAL